MEPREVNARINKFIVTNDLDYDPNKITGDPELAYIASQPKVEEPAAVEQPATEPAQNETTPAPAPETGDMGILIWILCAVAAISFTLTLKRKSKI